MEGRKRRGEAGERGEDVKGGERGRGREKGREAKGKGKGAGCAVVKIP